MRELIDWAKNDYGVNMKATIQEKKKYKFQIEDEVDFIFKVKEKYVTKRNNIAATKIQAAWKCWSYRSNYLGMRDYVIGMAVKIQAFVRMRRIRRRYLMRLAYLYQRSTVRIQRFLKGYLVYKRYNGLKKDLAFNKMTSNIEALKYRHAGDLCVKLAYVWKKYSKRKKQKLR